jgi:type I restriction-modification system DNA methylase subunit
MKTEYKQLSLFPLVTRCDFAQTIYIDSNFQTPIPVCEYMVGMVPDNSIKILEPTPGLGNIVNALNAKNRYQVVASDDFFLLDKTEKYDCIVMNPPFSSKSAFMQNAPEGVEVTGMKLGYYILTECMKMSNNIIALMPWYTIADSDVRMQYLVNFGIKSLTALPRKTFQYARIQTVIIELEKGYQEETIFIPFKF